MTSLPTRNPAWGFFGTVERSGIGIDPAAAWTLASTAVANATGGSAEAVRDFLDSRDGRHFADSVCDGVFLGEDLQGAINAAITRWMGWRIGRRMSRETGIPAGLPYLTGLVSQFEVLADAEG